MGKKIIFSTSPQGDGCWAVKKSGSDEVKSIHHTQTEAWKETKRLARGSSSEAVLLGKDGSIQASNIYHDDFTSIKS